MAVGDDQLPPSPPPPPPPSCNCGSIAYEIGHPCYAQCGGGYNQQSCQCSVHTYNPGHPCFTTCGGQQTPSAGQCPPKNGITRKWDPNRNQCVFDCPPGTGYEPNKQGCQPCPAGTSKSERGKCLPGLGAQGRGGGGGAGGGGLRAPFDPAASQSNFIWQQLLKQLNAPSRYTPAVMSSLLGQTKLTAEGQADLQKEEANAELQARGILRAPVAAEAQRQIRGNVSAQVMQSQNAILRAKIDADYTDKVTALKGMMDWLNSLRNYTAQMSATQAQLDLGMANITLGYARLQQEMDALRERYQQELSLLGLSGLI